MIRNTRKIIISILLIISILAIVSSANASVSLNPSTFNKDTINLAPNETTFILDPNLGEYNLNNNDKDIDINKSFTFKSSSSTKNAVFNLNNYNRLFYIGINGSLTLINITIKNGFHVSGSAIYNNGGTLNIDGCTFEKNSAKKGNGGAIFNDPNSTLTISNSVFKGNSASDGIVAGGAIYNWGSTKVNIINSIFIDNTAPTGGAIHNTGTLTVNGSTFKDNTAAYGGVIYNTGTLTVNRCTFIDNVANIDGDEIYGPSSVFNSVFYYNTELDIKLEASHDDCDSHDNSHTDDRVVIKVTTKTGKIITGQTIYLYVNGKYFGSKVTNNVGEAEFILDTANLKIYTIQAELRDFTKGNYQYLGSSKTKIISDEERRILNQSSNKNLTPAKKLTPAKIILIKKLTSKPVIKKGKKIYTKTFTCQNFGQTTGTKKFIISIGKKFKLFGKIKKTKYVIFKYNKKSKKITVTIQKLPYQKLATIKFKIQR